MEVRAGLAIAVAFWCLPTTLEAAEWVDVVAGRITPVETVHRPPSVRPAAILEPEPTAGAAFAVGRWGLTDDELRSFTCAASGTVGVVASAAAGATNLVNVVAGGAVAPGGTGALYVALAGVIFGTFCAIGVTTAPGILYLYDHVAEWVGVAATPRKP